MKKLLTAVLILGFALFAFGDLRNQQNMNGGMKVGEHGIKIGNIRCGTAALTNGTATVTDAYVTASTIILLSYNTVGGTPAGILRVSARTAGTSFVISSAAGDTSTIGYCMIEP